MLLSRRQDAGQNNNFKIANKLIENLAKYKCRGTKVINHNLIQEEIKSRLKSGNACYNSVQNLMSSRLLSQT
jgi:hypothetical protein